MVFPSPPQSLSHPQPEEQLEPTSPTHTYDTNHAHTIVQSPPSSTIGSYVHPQHRGVAILGAGKGINGLPVQAAGPGTTDLFASATARSTLDDNEVPMGFLYGDEISSLASSAGSSGRPFNPDLPAKNVLFVFANFASYMRAPHEGTEDVRDAQLRHAHRLLEHARELREEPLSRVEIMHIKYRFPVISLENKGTRVTSPFATLTDPVVKLDYKQIGGFEPTPTAAILKHIAQHIEPPPRVIVYSYVGSKQTAQHLGTLAIFCANRRVPITVISPTETRIREHQSLQLALQSAIDMPLYASLPLNQLANSQSFIRSHTGATIWAANPSTSGSPYLHAKEMILKSLGVASTSYLGIRWKLERSDSHSKVKVARFCDFESLVDSLDLGDQPSDDSRPHRQLESYIVSPNNQVMERRHARASTSSRGSKSKSKGLGQALLSEDERGVLAWRNMMAAHVDVSDAEYIEGNRA